MSTKQELRGALSSCVDQIEQMKDMFDDEDKAIADSLRDAASALRISKERRAFLEEVLTTFTGSSNPYWYRVTSTRHRKDGTITRCKVKTTEDEVQKIYRINVDTVERGIEQVLEKPGFQIANEFLGYIACGSRDNDSSDIDEVCADCIIQAGFFGELIYG